MLLRFAVFGTEMKFNFATCALLGRVDHAGIEGPGVDVQAHGALIEFAGIYDAMHGISGVYRARMSRVHFDRVPRFQAACSNG